MQHPRAGRVRGVVPLRVELDAEDRPIEPLERLHPAPRCARADGEAGRGLKELPVVPLEEALGRAKAEKEGTGGIELHVEEAARVAGGLGGALCRARFRSRLAPYGRLRVGVSCKRTIGTSRGHPEQA